MFWGLSEALDLLQEYLDANKEKKDQTSPPEDGTGDVVNDAPDPKPATLNILLYGASDPRHMIKTMAKLYTHRDAQKGNATPALHFYVVEGCAELLARIVALLGIALETADNVNLRSKVHLFMDVFGNVLLRPSSHQYMVSKAKTLQRVVMDERVREQLTPFLYIDGMKSRELDALDNAYHYWLPLEGHIFKVQKYWEDRLRGLLRGRYDYRSGAFDWDLNMTLKYRDAKQICNQEYRYFRETGIAFTYPEYEQCKPNKTLSIGLIRNGDKYLQRGYVGDIETGPFVAFGLRTADDAMTQSMHGENDYRATDITERNLLEFFHELSTRTNYTHDRSLSRKYGSVKLLMGERHSCDEDDTDAMVSYDQPWLNIEGVQVHLLSPETVMALQNNNEPWRDFFDVAFIGRTYFSFLKDAFVDVLRENGLLILETRLLTLMRNEAVNDFETKLKDFAKKANLKGVLNYNALNMLNSVLKYRKVIEK